MPGRTNIVLTRDAELRRAGRRVARRALTPRSSCARADAAARGVDDIMVIGGSDIFAATMPMADRLEITRVHASPDGDVVFPPIDPEQWRETRREHHARGPHDDADFTILTYER